MTMRVVIRADAGTVLEIGTGHVVRSITLADALVRSSIFDGAEVIFATRSEPPYELGASLAHQAGYWVGHGGQLVPNSELELASLLNFQPDVVIFDRLATTPKLMEGLRRAGVFVVTFDDLGGGRAHANVAIHPLLHGVDSRPNVFVGYQYLFPLHAERHSSETGSLAERVFVSFGGFDSRHLTDFVLDLIPKISGPTRYEVVAGELSNQKINVLLNRAETVARMAGVDVVVHQRPSDFFVRLAASDLAIVAGGLTAFECAHAGVPAVGLPQYEHQLENLERLESIGCLQRGGNGMALDAERLCGMVTTLVADQAQRRAMSQTGKLTIDGKGLSRTVALIAKEYLNFRGANA